MIGGQVRDAFIHRVAASGKSASGGSPPPGWRRRRCTPPRLPPAGSFTRSTISACYTTNPCPGARRPASAVARARHPLQQHPSSRHPKPWQQPRSSCGCSTRWTASGQRHSRPPPPPRSPRSSARRPLPPAAAHASPSMRSVPATTRQPPPCCCTTWRTVTPPAAAPRCPALTAAAAAAALVQSHSQQRASWRRNLQTGWSPAGGTSHAACCGAGTCAASWKHPAGACRG